MFFIVIVAAKRSLNDTGFCLHKSSAQRLKKLRKFNAGFLRPKKVYKFTWEGGGGVNSLISKSQILICEL